MATTFEPGTSDLLQAAVPAEYRLAEDFVPKSRYLSQEFLDLEIQRLFPRTWLIACREEEVHDPGDFVEFCVGDLTVIVLRGDDGRLRAFHNSCRHRGTRLVSGEGCVGEIRCRYHGWRWNLDGSTKLILDADDFAVPRCAEDLALQIVSLGTWGGWVFINADPNAEPLLEFLDPMPAVLDPCGFERMRYKYRRQTIVPLNWKAGLDAFIEGYHVPSTHPQTMRMGGASNTLPATLEELEFRSYIFSQSHPRGKHGNLGMFGRGRVHVDPTALLWSFMDPGDVVKMIEEQQAGIDRTPQSDLLAGEELRRGVPEGTDPFKYFQSLRKKYAEAAGIEWTELTSEQVEDIGIMWNIFPNIQISIIDVFGCLGFRFRPNGRDPDSAIFEMFVLEKPPTAELDTKRVVEIDHVSDWRDNDWGLLTNQDLRNYGDVVAGMRSPSFDGYNLNPVQESLVYHNHVVADSYLW